MLLVVFPTSAAASPRVRRSSITTSRLAPGTGLFAKDAFLPRDGFSIKPFYEVGRVAYPSHYHARTGRPERLADWFRRMIRGGPGGSRAQRRVGVRPAKLGVTVSTCHGRQSPSSL